MDLMKWINSLDELLYEVMSWLLFFPLTLWRSIIRPVAMMGYADNQIALPDDEQYSAALSPPLFLTLALFVSHGFSIALGQVDTIVSDRHGLAGLINDNTSALALRLVVFASFALFAATRFVRKSGLAIDRKSLRMPFYAQCYPTAVFALGVGLGGSLALVNDRVARSIGDILLVASILYYLVVEMHWFAARFQQGYMRTLGDVILVLAAGTTMLIAVGFLLAR